MQYGDSGLDSTNGIQNSRSDENWDYSASISRSSGRESRGSRRSRMSESFASSEFIQSDLENEKLYECDTTRRDYSPKFSNSHSFDGSGSRADWKTFKRSFRQIAREHEWDSHRKRRKLFSHLSGQALEYVHGLSDSKRKSYRKLMAALDKMYGQKDPPVTLHRKVPSQPLSVVHLN